MRWTRRRRSRDPLTASQVARLGETALEELRRYVKSTGASAASEVFEDAFRELYAGEPRAVRLANELQQWRGSIDEWFSIRNMLWFIETRPFDEAVDAAVERIRPLVEEGKRIRAFRGTYFLDRPDREAVRTFGARVPIRGTTPRVYVEGLFDSTGPTSIYKIAADISKAEVGPSRARALAVEIARILFSARKQFHQTAYWKNLIAGSGGS